MLPQNKPDRIRILFDDHRLVANAGLLLAATLARHLALRELLDHHLDLGGAPGRANTGDKMLTLVASALAGGDCIDDADALRAGGTFPVLACWLAWQWECSSARGLVHPETGRESIRPGVGRTSIAPEASHLMVNFVISTPPSARELDRHGGLRRRCARGLCCRYRPVERQANISRQWANPAPIIQSACNIAVTF